MEKSTSSERRQLVVEEVRCKEEAARWARANPKETWKLDRLGDYYGEEIHMARAVSHGV